MNLRNQIFLLTACVVAACTVLGTLLVRHQVDDAMREQTTSQLATTLQAIEQLDEERRVQREKLAALLAHMPVFTEGLAGGDRTALEEAVAQAQPLLHGSTFLAILDPRGAVLAATDPLSAAPSTRGLPPPEVRPIVSILSRHSNDAPEFAHGVWILDGAVYEVVATPLGPGDAALGALVLGLRLEDTAAQRLHRVTQSEVVILADDHLVGSSLSPPRAREVIGRFPGLDREKLEIEGPIRIEVGGVPHLARLASVPVDFGGLHCNHIILRSLQTSTELVNRVHDNLLLVGLLATVLAFAVAWIGSRRIALPLLRLADTMSHIAHSGRLEEPPVVGGGREVRIFQQVFRRMLDSLEDSQRERERSYVEAIGAVMSAVDRRDHESAGHSYRVAYYAVALAREMGLTGEELRSVEWGALLHDVGKIAVPDEILRKRGPLSEKEWQIMRNHPTWGYEMLADIRFLRPALDIVHNHHERWDGTGYPRGLAEEQIPLAARIFSLVDTYDAITSDRRYRRASSHDDAVAELRRVHGSQLDAAVVEAFLRIPYIELLRLRRLSERISSVHRVPPPLAEVFDSTRAGIHG